MRICVIENCGKPAKAKGYCRTHYQKHVYRQNNQQRVLENNRRWCAAHKDRIHLWNQERTRSLRGQWTTLRAQARKRKVEVSITFEHFCELRASNRCHYCYANLPEAGSGIDRKDNSKGYIAGNCVPCCDTCNRTKNHFLSYEEMCVVMSLRGHTPGAMKKSVLHEGQPIAENQPTLDWRQAITGQAA